MGTQKVMVKIFLGLLKKIKKISQRIILKKKSKTITKVFLSYDNILLKTYIDVTNSGNFNLLCTEGNATIEECYEAWEEILKRNGEATGDYSYKSFFDKLKTLAKLLKDYQLEKSMLLLLYFIIDENYIKYLRSKGYKILLKSTGDYTKSLNDSLRKCEHLITKITMRQKELLSSSTDPIKSNLVLDELLANISVGLGYEVSNNITLAKYNAYKKIIVAKHKQHGSRNKQAGFNNR